MGMLAAMETECAPGAEPRDCAAAGLRSLRVQRKGDFFLDSTAAPPPDVLLRGEFMGASCKVRVTLLGNCTIERQLPSGAFPEKGFQLLAMLCLAPRKECARQKLASLLWDSSGDAAALANLRQLVARIRRALPDADDFLVSSGQNLALGPLGRTVDLCVFRESLKATSASEREAGLRLYGGDLLDPVGDATDAFIEWLTLERAALRQEFLCGAEALLGEITRFARAPADTLNAIAARMLALEPEREATYRVLIDAFGRNGMIADSRRYLDAMRDVLAREPGAAPAAETVAVVRRVFSARQTANLPAEQAAEKRWLPRVMFLAPVWPQGTRGNRLMKSFIEDVANELARYRTFAVLAPHSSFGLKHDGGHARDNSLLRADYSINGFVKPDGGAGTLVLRMIGCETSQIVWSGEFRIGLEDLLKSFDALVVRVASSLAAGVEKDLVARQAHSADAAAYFRFLEGMRWLENCDLPRLRKARRSFKQALAADPAMASSAARIAQTLYLEWLQTGGGDPQLLSAARDHARLAIDADPNHPVGHWMEGSVALYQRDFDVCEAKFAEAETLCPNAPEFLLQYADALSHLGRTDVAWAKFERAIDLNPMPPDSYWWAGASIAFHRRDYVKTIELCGRLDSDESVLGLLCGSFAYLGNMPKARAYGRRIRENFPGGSALALGNIVPDRDETQREHSIQGLRMAGVT